MGSIDSNKNTLYDYPDPFPLVGSDASDEILSRYPRDIDQSMDIPSDGDNPLHSSTSASLDADYGNSTPDIMAIYYDTIAFENTVGIVIPTIYSLIIFIGLVGNALVITVVLLNRHMRNSTNMLIVNLAFADLLFLVFCVPFTAADYALPIWVFSYSWCQILQYLQYVTAYASVWTLVLMAFDRFLAVCLPVQSLTLRTVRNTLMVGGAVWVLILVMNVPLLQIYGIHRYYFIMEDRASCTFVAQANRTASEFQVQLHHLSFVTWGYLVPLSITCIFYFFMLRRLWWGMPASRLGSRSSEESIRAKKKVTWMVSGVITTFAICWAPLNACFAISALTYRFRGDHWVATKTFVIVQFASQILAYANSCLNPILYAFLSDNFRKGFFKICGFLFCCGESKLDFDRTNEYHGALNHTTTPAGTASRLSIQGQQSGITSSTSRIFSGKRRRKSSQQSAGKTTKQFRQSLITEEENRKKSSSGSGSGGPGSGGSRDTRRRSSPGHGASVRLQQADTLNGETVVLYKNNSIRDIEEGQEHKNGKNSVSILKRAPSGSKVKEEERLLDTTEFCDTSM